MTEPHQKPRRRNYHTRQRQATERHSLRREDGIFSQMDARFDEKMMFSRRRSPFDKKTTFTRRWTRASSSKWHLFAEGRALHRGCFCSQKAGRFTEVAFVRRRPGASPRLLLFADNRALHREKIACSRKQRLLSS